MIRDGWGAKNSPAGSRSGRCPRSAPCGRRPTLADAQAAGVPALSGVAEYVTQSPYDALLRLDKPGPGVAALGAFNFGGQSMVALNFYHYGDQAAETVARETPPWQGWIQDRFPMPTELK